jgi:hypothetical protein
MKKYSKSELSLNRIMSDITEIDISELTSEVIDLDLSEIPVSQKDRLIINKAVERYDNRKKIKQYFRYYNIIPEGRYWRIP